MDWLAILDFSVLGFTVMAIFIMYRDQKIHIRRLHIQSQKTWNRIAETHSHIEGLHDKYAKLYDRVTELEKTHEVHS